MLQFKKILIFMVTLFFSFSVFAVTLQEAKLKGWVGEQSDGYLGLVSRNIQPDNKKAVVSLLQKVNSQRKQEYLSIASNNGTSVSQVQTVAGKTLIDLAPSGEYVKTKTGIWVKK